MFSRMQTIVYVNSSCEIYIAELRLIWISDPDFFFFSDRDRTNFYTNFHQKDLRGYFFVARANWCKRKADVINTY